MSVCTQVRPLVSSICFTGQSHLSITSVYISVSPPVRPTSLSVFRLVFLACLSLTFVLSNSAVYLSACFSIYLSAHLSVCLSICHSVCRSICLSACLWSMSFLLSEFYRFVFPSVRLSISFISSVPRVLHSRSRFSRHVYLSRFVHNFLPFRSTLSVYFLPLPAP